MCSDWGAGIWKLSVLSIQFFSKSKSILKNLLSKKEEAVYSLGENIHNIYIYICKTIYPPKD